MMNLKKSRLLSKTIIFLSLSAILLTSTSPVEATIGDALRKAGGTLYEKIRGFDKTIVFDKLLKQIGKLGTQIGDIKDCMLYSFRCTPAKRAAFYGTAITILALTAVVVGFTITIAATSKEPDKDLKESVDITSKETKGLKPAAVFQRLGKRLAQFKQNLISTKQCLIKRQCTKKQKRALYATAGTIAGLVTITLGIGIGSYLYAKHKKEQEAAALPGEPTPTGAPAPAEGARPAFEFDETPLPEETPSRFKEFFHRKIQLAEEGVQSLKDAYQHIKEQVAKGIIRTKEVAAEKFREAVEKGKEFGHILQNAFQVSLEKLKEALSPIEEKLSKLKEAVSKKIIDATIGKTNVGSLALLLKDTQKNIELVKTMKKTELLEIAQSPLHDLEIKIGNVQQRVKEGKDPQSRLDALEKRLAIKKFIGLENLENLYAQLVSRVNGIRIDLLGKYFAKMLHGISSLIEAARSLHAHAGKIGQVIAPDDIQETLTRLKTNIDNLAERVTTSFEQLEQTSLVAKEEIALRGTEGIMTLVHALTGAISVIPDAIKSIKPTKAITNKVESLAPIVAQIKKDIPPFIQELKDIVHNTKEKFFEYIKKNVLKNMPHAPRILRQAFRETVAENSAAFKKLMEDSLSLLKQVKDITPSMHSLMQQFNSFITKILNEPFINPRVIEALDPILQQNIPAISEEAGKALGDVQTNIPTAEPAEA